METLLAFHEVDDVDHWLASPGADFAPDASGWIEGAMASGAAAAAQLRRSVPIVRTCPRQQEL